MNNVSQRAMVKWVKLGMRPDSRFKQTDSILIKQQANLKLVLHNWLVSWPDKQGLQMKLKAFFQCFGHCGCHFLCKVAHVPKQNVGDCKPASHFRLASMMSQQNLMRCDVAGVFTFLGDCAAHTHMESRPTHHICSEQATIAQGSCKGSAGSA